MIVSTRILAPLLVALFFCSNLYSREIPENGSVLKVKKGETLLKILRKHGWKQKDLALVLNHPQLRKRNIFPKEIYYKTSKPDMIVLFERMSDKAFFISKDNISLEPVQYQTKRQKVSGKVRGSLQASILNKINSTDIAQRFMNAYLLDYNLRRDIIRNAPFSLEYEKKYIGKTFIKYGEVTQASLQFRNGKTETRNFVFFKNSGGSFISNKQKNKLFYAPVKYLNITSLYQPRRRHPITKKIIPHMGIDFELPTGSPVLASASGTVIKRGKNRAAGRYIVIDHHNGYKSYYNHLSKVENLAIGHNVIAGDMVGQIGCSGYCTKPHLHFSIKKNGRFVNPAKLIYTHPYTQNNLVQAYLSQN